IDRFDPPSNVGASMTWAPANVEELRDEYEVTVGQGRLDLRDVEFPPGETELTVRVTIGEMVVLVPPDVNVRAQVDVRAGDAVVFGHRPYGSNAMVDSTGADGADGP